MKKSILILILIFLSLSLSTIAQDVVLEQKPDQFIGGTFGANKDWFAQLSFGFGTLVGKGDAGLSYNDWRSNDVRISIKLKRKINGLLSVWLEPGYHYAAYNINQSGNRVTDSLFWGGFPINHEKERFATEGLLINGFLRFNIDTKRGNFLGYYLDLGAGADVIADREYLTIDKRTDGSQVRASVTNIPYMNNLDYNVLARIGINWIAFTLNYRISPLFKSQYNIPEPAIITAGIELNPYSH